MSARIVFGIRSKLRIAGNVSKLFALGRLQVVVVMYFRIVVERKRLTIKCNSIGISW